MTTSGPAVQTLRVDLPGGDHYFTVVDERFQLVELLDDYLRHLRLGRDCRPSTTQSRAGGLALYGTWCLLTGRSLHDGAFHLGDFMLWATHWRGDLRVAAVDREVRSPARINSVLSSVRGFLSHEVAMRRAPDGVMAALFRSRGEFGRVLRRGPGLSPRHGKVVAKRRPPRISDEVVLGLLQACLCARDRFYVICALRTGLRRGELLGLRLEDMHTSPDSGALACDEPGPHLHVVPRLNANGASAKSPHERVVPTDALVVQSYDAYVLERDRLRASGLSDFVLVNIRRGPVGGPMRLGAPNDMFDALSKRAGLEHKVNPHMCRHTFINELLDAGAQPDQAQKLAGHASLASLTPYLHPSMERLREAVERLPPLPDESEESW